MTEKQIEKIKSDIKSHRAALAAEKRRFGWYDDSYGRRYIIAELYMKIMDYQGALRYFKWFGKIFDDDIGSPEFNLFWAATLFENNKIEQAEQKTFETVFSNIYLIEMICGNTINDGGFEGYSNLETEKFAKEILSQCIKYISKEFRSWLCEFIQTEKYQTALINYLALNKQIRVENPGEKRTALLNTQSSFISNLTGR
ncbi:MAG: hypothetical protein H6540_09800 [Bacteroidales bacterium]|nr:hypothetical protein [Bacteroidales bacterium]